MDRMDRTHGMDGLYGWQRLDGLDRIHGMDWVGWKERRFWNGWR